MSCAGGGALQCGIGRAGCGTARTLQPCVCPPLCCPLRSLDGGFSFTIRFDAVPPLTWKTPYGELQVGAGIWPELRRDLQPGLSASLPTYAALPAHGRWTEKLRRCCFCPAVLPRASPSSACRTQGSPAAEHQCPLCLLLPQVAVESTGDESGDAAEVERQLLSLLKSKAQLKARREFCTAFESGTAGRWLQGSVNTHWRPVLVGWANLPGVCPPRPAAAHNANLAQQHAYTTVV